MNGFRPIGLVLVGAGVAGFLFDPTALSRVAASPTVLPYALGVAIVMAVWIALLASGIRKVGAVTAAVVSAIEPVLVAVAGLLLLSEGLELREVAGGLLVMAGVLLVSLTAAGERPLSTR